MGRLNKESLAKIDEIVKTHKGKRGPVKLMLHDVQRELGYIPLEAMEKIADGAGVSVADVYGVVTFYTQFTTQPKGKHVINVCLGTACYVKGSGDILDEFKNKLGIDVGQCTPDAKYSLEATRCIGACGLAPVLTVNDEVYGRLTKHDVDDIMKKYV